MAVRPPCTIGCANNGIKGVRVDRTIAQLLAAHRDLFDRRDSSTPIAMVDLLKRIYQGDLIKPASRNYLLGLMAQCATGKNRMKWLLPAGTPVEHKTGTLDGLSDDVGFITMPNGHHIAIAIFTRGGSDRPRTIAEAARTIYDGFTRVVDLALQRRRRRHSLVKRACSCTSSPEERSAGVPRPIWSTAI